MMQTHPSNAAASAPAPPTSEQVVLVHCSASSAGQWRSLGEHLGAAYETTAIKLRGHGQGEVWGGDGPLSLAVEADAIARAVDDGRRFHLVGHSYGGAVALRLARGYPACLASLTVIEPSCFHVLKEAGEEAHLLDEISALAEAVNRGVISGDYRGAMESFIDYWGGPGSWARLGEERRGRLANLAVPVAHHFWSLLKEETPLAAYGAIAAPTLIVCGTRSPKPSRAITRLLAAAMPNSKHRTIANASHMSPITHPSHVNPIIGAHLRQTGGGRPQSENPILPAHQRPFRHPAPAPVRAA